MPANILVSCSIFLLYLIFGNWPNLCPTVGTWQREGYRTEKKICRWQGELVYVAANVCELA